MQSATFVYHLKFSWPKLESQNYVVKLEHCRTPPSVNWHSSCSEAYQFWLDVQEVSSKHKYNQEQIKNGLVLWLKTFRIPLTADCKEGESRDAKSLIMCRIPPGSIIYSDCRLSGAITKTWIHTNKSNIANILLNLQTGISTTKQ